MKVLCVLLCATIACLVGYTVGLLEYCERTPSLHKVKKYVWLIPSALVAYPFRVLFSPGVDRRFLKLFVFFRLPEKGVFLVNALEGFVLTQWGMAYNRQEKRKSPKKRNVMQALSSLEIFKFEGSVAAYY